MCACVRVCECVRVFVCMRVCGRQYVKHRKACVLLRTLIRYEQVSSVVG